MPHKNRNRKLARGALGAALGIILVIAGATVGFAGDDEEDDLPDAKFMRGLLRGLGLRNGQEPGINYQERPPLVVPPSRDLPVPAKAGSLAATNPAWPADPDEKKRNAERKARAERKPYNPDTDGNPLRPDELAVGKTNKPAVATVRGPDRSPEMTPSELGYTGGLWSSFLSLGKSFSKDKEPEIGKFVREPPRNALTDPPVGYRSPSPAQPYGINSKTETPKAEREDRQTGYFGK